MLASSNGCYFPSASSSNGAPPLGLEPRTSKLTVLRSNQLSYFCLKEVDPGPTCRSRRYGRALLKVYFVAGGGTRTPDPEVMSLVSYHCSTPLFCYTKIHQIFEYPSIFLYPLRDSNSQYFIRSEEVYPLT